VLTITQKRFFGSLDELALFVEPDIKWSMILWASAGGAKRPFAPWKLGLRTKYFWKNLKSASWFRLIDLILAMTVLLPVLNSHCTRVRVTVTASCSDELAVHSCPLLCLQRWVTKISAKHLPKTKTSTIVET